MTTVETMTIASHQVQATLLALKSNTVHGSREVDEAVKDVKQWASNRGNEVASRLLCDEPMDYGRAEDKLIEIYVWNTWNLMIVGAAQLVGSSTVIETLISPLVSKPLAFLLAMFIMPYLFYQYHIQAVVHPTPRVSRFILLMLCVPMGLLSGYSMADFNLHIFVPPAFVTTMLMAAVSHTVAETAYSRTAHIAMVVGSGAVLSIGGAMALSNVNPLFIIFLFLNVIVNAIDMLIKIDAAQAEGDLAPLISLLFSVVSALAIDYPIAFYTPEGEQTYMLA